MILIPPFPSPMTPPTPLHPTAPGSLKDSQAPQVRDLPGARFTHVSGIASRDGDLNVKWSSFLNEKFSAGKGIRLYRFS